MPWVLSAFLAFSLFTTFTYQPPDLPDKHPHIVHNEITASSVNLMPGLGSSSRSLLPSNSEEDNAQSQQMVDGVARDVSFGEVDLESLHLPINATTVDLSQVPDIHPMQQNPIMSVLREALVNEISLDDWKELPNLARNLSDLYGSRIVSKGEKAANTGPIVLGMETCEAYRKAVPLEDRYVGAAGMFNTGTNALEHHLERNVLNVGSVWQVPWGKNLSFEIVKFGMCLKLWFVRCRKAQNAIPASETCSPRDE